MKKTRFEKLKQDREQKDHVAELASDYRYSTDKWKFLKDHLGIFSSGLPNIKYVFPNNDNQYTLNAHPFPILSQTYVSAGFTFTTPYKITFRIAITSLGTKPNFLPLIFIRDTINDDPNNGTTWPSAINGNMFIFGQGSGLNSDDNFQAVTQTDFGTVVDSSFGPSAPLYSALITVQEQTPNAIQVNVFDGAAFNTQAYTSITGVFTTPLRNIGLFAKRLGTQVGNGLDEQFEITNTVAW